MLHGCGVGEVLEDISLCPISESSLRVQRQFLAFHCRRCCRVAEIMFDALILYPSCDRSPSFPFHALSCTSDPPPAGSFPPCSSSDSGANPQCALGDGISTDLCVGGCGEGARESEARSESSKSSGAVRCLQCEIHSPRVHQHPAEQKSQPSSPRLLPNHSLVALAAHIERHASDVSERAKNDNLAVLPKRSQLPGYRAVSRLSSDSTRTLSWLLQGRSS